MQRTQIYLPEDLRREIDINRHKNGESLADYLREAAKQRLNKEKKKKTDLKKLADDFIGCSTKTDDEIQEWLDWVREERRLSDEVREDRLKKAAKK